ncbi:hypothetical protein QTV43_000106 [Vibrio vulnificus]|nr:hypothetical protein [Vibrio vulnificus]
MEMIQAFKTFVTNSIQDKADFYSVPANCATLNVSTQLLPTKLNDALAILPNLTEEQWDELGKFYSIDQYDMERLTASDMAHYITQKFSADYDLEDDLHDFLASQHD